MKPEIACFLTCGYTEMGFTQGFLERMNPKCNYRQCLPFKKKQKKELSPSIRGDICGLTGDALLRKVYEIVYDCKEQFQHYSAILIEDDLDGRFHEWDEERISAYIADIRKRITERLGKDIPVFFLYASPEIESWFIADWENGFSYLYKEGYEYKDRFTLSDRKFFLHCLKKYIEHNILGEFSESMEEYWRINEDGKPLKLSTQIMCGIQSGIVDSIEEDQTHQQFLARFRAAKPAYSKSEHGRIMLRRLNPNEVFKKCKKYFAPSYMELQAFSPHRDGQ